MAWSRVGGGVVAGGEGAGVLADEVVEAIPARGGLVDEMVGVQGVQILACLRERDAGQGGGRVGVDIGAGVQAEEAEQPLRARGQVGVRHIERGGDRRVTGPVSGSELGEPVPGGGEICGEAGDGPAGVMGQAAGEQGDGQRQVPAPGDHVRHPPGGRGVQRATGQAGEQLGGLTGRQGVQGQRLRARQGDQAAAAGDQHQAPPGAGQQRLDLGRPGGVVQHQQHPPARQAAAPPLRPRLQPRRDLPRTQASAGQQPGEHLGGVGRRQARGMRVQADEQLPVGEVIREQVRGAGHQRGLAHPRHAIHRVDRDHPGRPRSGRGEPAQLGVAAGEGRHVPRQRPHRRHRTRRRLAARNVLVQHPLVSLGQLRAGVNPQLLIQPPPQPLVDRDRGGLLPGPG